jgi:hypothetical protein
LEKVPEPERVVGVRVQLPWSRMAFGPAWDGTMKTVEATDRSPEDGFQEACAWPVQVSMETVAVPPSWSRKTITPR